jgi:hypothetical protein
LPKFYVDRSALESIISVQGELLAPAIKEKNGEIEIYDAKTVLLDNAYIDASGLGEGEKGGKVVI